MCVCFSTKKLNAGTEGKRSFRTAGNPFLLLQKSQSADQLVAHGFAHLQGMPSQLHEVSFDGSHFVDVHYMRPVYPDKILVVDLFVNVIHADRLDVGLAFGDDIAIRALSLKEKNVL
jgi:hypothetical protein